MYPRDRERYTRVTLVVLEQYISKHKRGCTLSYALNRAFGSIESVAKGVYEIDGVTDFYSSDAYSKFNVAVEFVADAIKVLNEKSEPDDRMKAHEKRRQHDIYDHIANLIFELILAASAVKSPRDTCWTVHYNSLWSRLFTFSERRKAERIIFYRLRRLLYDEICRLSTMPNYKSARILAICLNILGPVIHDRKTSYQEDQFALHKVIVSWLKKNYMTLRQRQPDVADACLIGSITYDAENERIAKSYIKGLNLEEPKEYLDLDPPRPSPSPA